MSHPVIAVTLGDPGGVGPEIIARVFEKRRIRKSAFVIFGTEQVFKDLHARLNLGIPCKKTEQLSRDVLRPGGLYLWDIASALKSVPHLSAGASVASGYDIGSVSERNGALSYAAVFLAAQAVSKGLIDGIVTAPINKSSVRYVQPGFSGHTEMLAEISETQEFAMMFVGSRFHVTLVTVHMALKDVSASLTKEKVLSRICLTHHFLTNYFGKTRPRIAVCALNPHGRETGTEEDAVISPAVEAAQWDGVHVFGPFPADQLFHEAFEGRYDAVISMYHDQGLGPFKMVSFKDGVNVTLGLPFVRTSPDHGTAFDIAWQGKADSSSMKAAVDLAEKLLLNKRHVNAG